MWIVLSISFALSGPDLIVTVLTDLAAHLYLLWTFTAPTKVQRWKNNRGVLEKCGWDYSFHATVCTEQNQPGDTTTHTFALGSLPAHELLYFFLATGCTYVPGDQTSPPLELTVPECPPAFPHQAFLNASFSYTVT